MDNMYEVVEIDNGLRYNDPSEASSWWKTELENSYLYVITNPDLPFGKNSVYIIKLHGPLEEVSAKLKRLILIPLLVAQHGCRVRTMGNSYIDKVVAEACRPEVHYGHIVADGGAVSLSYGFEGVTSKVELFWMDWRGQRWLAGTVGRKRADAVSRGRGPVVQISGEGARQSIHKVLFPDRFRCYRDRLLRRALQYLPPLPEKIAEPVLVERDGLLVTVRDGQATFDYRLWVGTPIGWVEVVSRARGIRNPFRLLSRLGITRAKQHVWTEALGTQVLVKLLCVQSEDTLNSHC